MKIAIAMWVALLMMVSIVPVASAEEVTAEGYSPTTTNGYFETVRPEVDVVPGQSVSVMVKTPSGKSVSIAIKINGVDR